MIKYLKEGFILIPGLMVLAIMVGKAWRQLLTLCQQSGNRGDCHVSLALYFVLGPGPQSRELNYLPTKWAFSTKLNLSGILSEDFLIFDPSTEYTI